MAQQKVELRKIRDFSDNLNDTFVFIRQNLKPVLTCFIGISGIFMLGSAIIKGIYQNEMSGIVERVFRGSPDVDEETVVDSLLSPTHFLVGLLAWLNVIAMRVSIVAYVKVYERKGGAAPEFKEVWAEFSKYYFKVFLYSLPIILVTLFGFVLCIIPGVYLWVVLMPFEMVLMVEEKSFGNAWDRCMTIIKENFWISFAIYAVAYLIYTISSGIVGGIMSVFTAILTYFSTRDFSTSMGIFTSIMNLFSFVFFIVFYISAILNYFSLVEKQDGTGILKRLENIGNASSPHNIDEEY